jgi:hypothetical protein
VVGITNVFTPLAGAQGVSVKPAKAQPKANVA